MSHLLAITVGPVQEFIASARRTRDLWFGSYLLSEVSKAVAKSVRDQHGELIFPPPRTNLEPDPNVNVANVILAELSAGDPKKVAEKAKEAAQQRWLEFAADARSEASRVIRADIWEDQVDNVIEFYASWVARSDNYQLDRARVIRLLGGRKNSKDFLAAKGRAGVPKSSLDGQRESVLMKGDRDNWPKKLRLSDGEQLDVVGIIKRMAERNRPYPSVARVAAETWLRGRESRGNLAALKAACHKLLDKGLNQVRDEKYRYFPYEGTVIYKDRHTDLRKELGLGEHDLDDVAAALKNLGGEPTPYLAVLVADGDSMGAALSELASIPAHQALSQSLAAFAVAAKTIVADHYGVLVYAGGDDVLAFVPVHKCLSCARSLRDQFHQETGMTLSVGVAIGHFMENLEDLRDYGQKAEKAAKNIPGKDALAVHVHKRGGAPIEVRGRWSDEMPLDSRLANFAELVNENVIPSKLPYELRSMAKLYEPWSEANARAAIKVDLLRLIAKKQSKGIQTVREKLDSHLKDMTAEKLLTLAQELLVARLLATALKQATEAAS